MATITLKYDANCKDCAAFLQAGTKARWHGRTGTFGIGCHEKDGTLNAGFDRETIAAGPPSRKTPRTTAPAQRATGVMLASKLDPTGFYAADGTLIGRTNAKGRCEDAPCCGCCS